jgi:hypothetical protein
MATVAAKKTVVSFTVELSKDEADMLVCILGCTQISDDTDVDRDKRPQGVYEALLAAGADASAFEVRDEDGFRTDFAELTVSRR